MTPGCAGHLPGIDSPVETPRSRVVGVLTPALLNVNIPSLSIAKDTDLSTNRNTFLNVGFTFLEKTCFLNAVQSSNIWNIMTNLTIFLIWSQQVKLAEAQVK